MKTTSARKARTGFILTLMFLVCCATAACTTMKRQAMRASFKQSLAEYFVPGTEVVKVADDLYVHRWVGHWSAFLLTDAGAVVIDPSSREAARDVAQAVERVSPGTQVKTVIYSHHHRDHASGAKVFGDDVEIVAHANAARDIAARSYDDVRAPTQVFEESTYDLEVGGKLIRLHLLAPAHTDGLLAIEIPHRGAVYTADLVEDRAMPFAGGADASFFHSKAALKQLEALSFDVFLSGHRGPVGREVVREYAGFLDALEAAARATMQEHDVDLHSSETLTRVPEIYADLLFETEDRLQPKYGDWKGFDDLMMPTAQWCLLSLINGG